MAEPGIRQERKRQPEPRGVARVTLRGRGVHAEGPTPLALVKGQVVAHGGQLPISAGRVVARIERQQHPVTRRAGRAARMSARPTPARRMPARWRPARQQRSRGRGRGGPARSSSSRSSHSSGTSCDPSAPWVSPGSGSPCQSLPPVRSRPSRSAMSVSRARRSAIVTGVAGLDRVETLAPEPLEERARAPLLEVGDRDHAAHRVHHVGDLAERRAAILSTNAGPAAADVAVERVGDVDGAALAYDRARDVGPPHRAALRLAQHVVELERTPELLQPAHHLAAAPHPVGAAPLQKASSSADSDGRK